MPIVLPTPWPAALAAAAVLAAATFIASRRLRYSDDPDSRRIRFKATSVLLWTGIALLAVAAASPTWIHDGKGRITVMVDLSPSTRGADYRDRHRLTDRVAQLIGDTPFDLLAFAGSNAPLPAGETLPDLQTEHTVFAPPPGQPVLLFSDGQFELPTDSPPVFPVIDPQLISPDDSAVAALDVNGPTATATVRHAGPARVATWNGGESTEPVRVDTPLVFSTQSDTKGPIALSLNGGDRWPENDSLTSLPSPPEKRPRLWIGDRDPGPGWLYLRPSQLPASPAAWLDPLVIVLDNVAANALGRVQQDALQVYARELGGGMILLGGDHAFAAGGYGATPLGAISPLADAPPTPAARWIILSDASGSMSARSPAGGSLFDAECAAADGLLPLLPPADQVRIGSFAQGTQWWFEGSVAEARDQKFPPVGTFPNGPTALGPALQSAMTNASVPTRVLLMTDADTDPVDLAATGDRAKLLVLALGHGAALPSLTELSRRTGGAVVEQADPTRWAASARDLLKAQLPDQLERSRVEVKFENELKLLGTRPIDRWNRTWLKRDATELATTGDAPMVARWQVGAGAVAAAAYAMSPADAAAVANQVGSDPNDPRFSIRWETRTARPRVTITAAASGRFLNAQPLLLTVVDPESGVPNLPLSIPQTGPGRYSVQLPPADRTRFVRIAVGPHTVDRRAIAGRYAEEFELIGVNREKLNDLAARTGGVVVDSTDTKRLAMHVAGSQIDFTETMLGLGSIIIACGLWLWKRNL